MKNKELFKAIVNGTINKVPEVPMAISDIVEDRFIDELGKLYEEYDSNLVSWFLSNWLTNTDEITLIAKHLAAISYIVDGLQGVRAEEVARLQLSSLMSIVKNRLCYISKYFECYKLEMQSSVPYIRAKIGTPMKFRNMAIKADCLRPYLRKRFGADTDAYLLQQEEEFREEFGKPYWIYSPACFSRQSVFSVKFILENRDPVLLALTTSSKILLWVCKCIEETDLKSSELIRLLQFRSSEIHEIFLSAERRDLSAISIANNISAKPYTSDYLRLLDCCVRESRLRGYNPLLFVEKDYSYEQLKLLLRALKHNVLIDELKDNTLTTYYMKQLIDVLCISDKRI